MYFTPTFFVLPLFEKAPETSKEKALTLFYTFPLWKKKKKKKTTFEKREKESRERRRFCDDDSSCAFFFSEELKRERERRLDFSALLCVQFLNDTLTRETVKRKDTIGERHHVSIQTRALRGCDFETTYTFFFPFLLSLSSLSFLSEHAQRDRRRRLRRRLRFLLRVSFRLLLLSLGGVSLFQKSFCLYWNDAAADDDEILVWDATTETKKKERRKRTNRRKSVVFEKPFASRAYPIHKY